MTIITRNAVTSSGMPVVVTAPDGPGPHPAVMLMHERYGLVQHTLDIGERLSHNGYLVACPDLYHAYPDQEALHRGDASVRAADATVIGQLEEVEQLIAKEGNADLGRLAVMGVCASGRYPLAYGASHPIRGCITFYGGMSDEAWSSNDLHPTPMETYLDTLEAPVLGAYGEADHTIPISDVIKFRNALEARDKTYQITIYKDAPHGWLNDTMPGRYRKDTAEQTWAELLGYLSTVLAAERPTNGDTISWTFTASKGSDYDFTKNVRLE